MSFRSGSGESAGIQLGRAMGSAVAVERADRACSDRLLDSAVAVENPLEVFSRNPFDSVDLRLNCDPGL